MEYTQTERYEKVILWYPSLERCREYLDSLGWSLLDDLIDNNGKLDKFFEIFKLYEWERGYEWIEKLL